MPPHPAYFLDFIAAQGDDGWSCYTGGTRGLPSPSVSFSQVQLWASASSVLLVDPSDLPFSSRKPPQLLAQAPILGSLVNLCTLVSLIQEGTELHVQFHI
jgi:hypothetical protein